MKSAEAEERARLERCLQSIDEKLGVVDARLHAYGREIRDRNAYM